MCTIISVNTRLTHRDARPNPKSQPATVRTTQRWGRPYPIHYVARLASNERAIWDATSIRDISLCALALACDANASARACSPWAVNTHRIFKKMNVRVQPSRFKLIKKNGKHSALFFVEGVPDWTPLLHLRKCRCDQHRPPFSAPLSSSLSGRKWRRRRANVRKKEQCAQTVTSERLKIATTDNSSI